MKLISYYDLLGMIKEGNIPDKVYLYMLNRKVAYIKDVDAVSNEFNGYMLKNPNKDQNENFKYYLGECFLESSMFDECIELEKTFAEEIINLGRSITEKFSLLTEELKKILKIEDLTLEDLTLEDAKVAEDKEIEKIVYIGYGEDGNIQYEIIGKINELIDVVNKLNKGE